MNRACGWASPQRHRPIRRRQLPQLLSFLCVAAALGLAGCGSTRPATPTSTPTPTPVASTPTPTVDPTDAAIIYGYDQAMAAWLAAAAIPSPQYPGISQWYAGVALTLAEGRLGALQQVDWVVVGTYTPHPVVISVDGGTATVQDCGSNTTYVADEGSTTPASPQPAAGTTPFDGTAAVGWNNVTVTMILQAGTWRLSQGVTEATPCTPASPSP